MLDSFISSFLNKIKMTIMYYRRQLFVFPKIKNKSLFSFLQLISKNINHAKRILNIKQSFEIAIKINVNKVSGRILSSDARFWYR